MGHCICFVPMGYLYRSRVTLVFAFHPAAQDVHLSILFLKDPTIQCNEGQRGRAWEPTPSATVLGPVRATQSMPTSSATTLGFVRVEGPADIISYKAGIRHTSVSVRADIISHTAGIGACDKGRACTTATKLKAGKRQSASHIISYSAGSSSCIFISCSLSQAASGRLD